MGLVGWRGCTDWIPDEFQNACYRSLARSGVEDFGAFVGGTSSRGFYQICEPGLSRNCHILGVIYHVLAWRSKLNLTNRSTHFAPYLTSSDVGGLGSRASRELLSTRPHGLAQANQPKLNGLFWIGINSHGIPQMPRGPARGSALHHRNFACLGLFSSVYCWGQTGYASSKLFFILWQANPEHG